MSTAIEAGAAMDQQAPGYELSRRSSLFTPSRPEIAATSQVDASDGPEAPVRCAGGPLSPSAWPAARSALSFSEFGSPV